MKEITFEFELECQVETWGKYVKGDRDIFFIELLDEQNGLIRFPIDKQWKVVSYKIIN